MFAPFVGLGDGLAVFFRERFIVDGSERKFAGYRIKHRLQEGFHGGQLAGRKLIDQVVKVVASIAVDGAPFTAALSLHG